MWTAVLHLTDILYVTVTSWGEVKTSAASLDKERKQSENSNSWSWAPITISTLNTTVSSTLEQKNRTVAQQFSSMTQRTLSTKDKELSWGMWNWKVLFRDGLESQAFDNSEKLGYLSFSNRIYFLLLMQIFSAWRCLVENAISARRELSSQLVEKSVFWIFTIYNSKNYSRKER